MCVNFKKIGRALFVLRPDNPKFGHAGRKLKLENIGQYGRVAYQTKAYGVASSFMFILTTRNLADPMLYPKNPIYGPFARIFGIIEN